MTLSMMGMGMGMMILMMILMMMMMDSECKEEARWNGKKSLEKSRVGGDFPNYLFTRIPKLFLHHPTFFQPLDDSFLF